MSWPNEIKSSDFSRIFTSKYQEMRIAWTDELTDACLNPRVFFFYNLKKKMKTILHIKCFSPSMIRYKRRASLGSLEYHQKKEVQRSSPVRQLKWKTTAGGEDDDDDDEEEAVVKSTLLFFSDSGQFSSPAATLLLHSQTRVVKMMEKKKKNRILLSTASLSVTFHTSTQPNRPRLRLSRLGRYP